MGIIKLELLEKLLFKKVFLLNEDGKEIFYIGGSDVLPPPLTKEEEEDAIAGLVKGNQEARNT